MKTEVQCGSVSYGQQFAYEASPGFRLPKKYNGNESVTAK